MTFEKSGTCLENAFAVDHLFLKYALKETTMYDETLIRLCV